LSKHQEPEYRPEQLLTTISVLADLWRNNDYFKEKTLPRAIENAKSTLVKDFGITPEIASEMVDNAVTPKGVVHVARDCNAPGQPAESASTN
jgi:hypothetical protein